MSSVQNKSSALSSSFLNSSMRPGSREQASGTSSLLPSTYPTLTSWGSTASIWSKPGTSFAANGLTSTAAQPRSLALEAVEGKTGSGALVDSSVSDDSWATRTSTFAPKITNRPTVDFKADISFGQQRDSTNNATTSQAYGGASRHNSTTATFGTRHIPVNLTTTNGSKGSFANNFELPASSLASTAEPPQVFTKFNNSNINQTRPADSAWGDGPILPSPVDERKSSNTTGFSFTSQASSRNNSLPPSRHSDVQPQFPPVRSEMYPETQSAAHTLRQSSISSVSRPNGPGSYRSDSSINPLSMQFVQMNVGGGEVQGFGDHQRGSVSGHLPLYNNPSPLSTRAAPYNGASVSFEAEEADDITRAFQAQAGDAYHSQTNGDSQNYMPQFETRQYGNNAVQYSRQAPPHYAGSAASQRSFDRLNISQSMNSYNNTANGHAAVLEQRLRQVQQEHQFNPDSRHLAMMNRQAPQNMYGQYAFAHGMPVYNMPIHPSFAQGLPMGMMPVVDLSMVPKAPRSEQFESGHSVRSQILEDFKQNAKTNKRYELKDIYDHVVEFSGDQHGSRFIQLKLETANSDEKECIFREIQPNALQLMTDVFGNYVIQKFFEHGDQTQKKILANKMRGQVRQLSLQMYGCRVVQKALDHILNDQQAALILELKDDVIRCVKDQNGNHVIQKAIERCDPKDIEFIFNAFTNQIHTLSIHTYGCRVIQRCLEHCELSTRRSILRELRESMPGLIGDAFGNYVVQHVVVHGEEHDKQNVFDLIIKGLEGFSKHKFASNVVEQCLTHASDSWRKEVLSIIIAGNRREGEGMLIGFIRDNYGNYVIQKLLDVISQSDYYNFIAVLQQEMNKAKRSGCGKQVMAIEKKMHRFGPTYNPLHISVPVPFASHNISTATTPPPLTSDTRSVQTSSVASVNGDAIEGAGLPTVRKGSMPSTEPAVYGDYGH